MANACKYSNFKLDIKFPICLSLSSQCENSQLGNFHDSEYSQLDGYRTRSQMGERNAAFVVIFVVNDYIFFKIQSEWVYNGKSVIPEIVMLNVSNNERIEQGYFLHIWDNLRDTVYNYIAANKVLFNKNIIHDINAVTKSPRTTTIYFLSRNVS